MVRRKLHICIFSLFAVLLVFNDILCNPCVNTQREHMLFSAIREQEPIDYEIVYNKPTVQRDSGTYFYQQTNDRTESALLALNRCSITSLSALQAMFVIKNLSHAKVRLTFVGEHEEDMQTEKENLKDRQYSLFESIQVIQLGRKLYMFTVENDYGLHNQTGLRAGIGRYIAVYNIDNPEIFLQVPDIVEDPYTTGIELECNLVQLKIKKKLHRIPDVIRGLFHIYCFFFACDYLLYKIRRGKKKGNRAMKR